MDIVQAFAVALKKARIVKKLTQEDFSIVSGRTYISTLERGMYAPTLAKIELLSNRMGLHPVTLISLAYLSKNSDIDIEILLNQVRSEIHEISISENFDHL